MSTHLLDLGTILAAWLVVTSAYLGWGRLTARCLGIGFHHSERAFGHIWLGWATTLLILQLWHLGAAVDFYAGLAIYGFGLIVFLSRALRHIRRYFGSITRPANWVFIILLFIAACWIASKSMLSPTNYDSGLYHFNSIRWLNEHGIVPGLGNLHERLAFNQSFFVFVASLNLFPLFEHGYNLANSFLITVVSAECLLFVFRRFGHYSRDEWKGEASAFIPLLFLPLLFYIAVNTSLSSPSPDTASTLLQLIVFLHLWRLVDHRQFSRSRVFKTKFIIILAATAVTVKLSNLALGTLTALAAVFICFRCCSGPYRELLKKFRFAALFAVASLMVWSGRGVIESGYPLFPSTALQVNTDWSVPVKKAQSTANWVYSWARKPSVHWRKVLGNWDWFAPWLRNIATSDHHRIEVVYPFCTSLLILLIGALLPFIRFGRRPSSSVAIYYLLLLPVTGGLVFWFFTAPDPRFAHAIFLILPLAAAAPLIAKFNSLHLKRAALITLSVIVSFPYLLWIFLDPINLWRISNVGFQPVRSVRLVEKTTLSGLSIYAPKRGDQCWDSPLPCTPYFNEHLRVRGSDLRSGFSVKADDPVKPDQGVIRKQ